MAIGFIKDELDMKMLILYIMNHVAAPIDFYKVIELGMCDSGVDYFSLSAALADLVEKGHLQLEDGRYSITDRGRRNSQITEGSLPYSVRCKCDRNLVPLNKALRRDAQVRGESSPNPDGTCTVKLTLDDDAGNLMTLSLLAASAAHADLLIRRFQANPEQVYNGILNTLLTDFGDSTGKAAT